MHTPTSVGVFRIHSGLDYHADAMDMSRTDSIHMDPEEFRKHGHAMIDFIAEYLGREPKRPVRSEVEPGFVRSRLPEHPPEAGEPFESVMKDVREIIMPGITHWQSPDFFAYFPANNSEPSILGELLSAGLGVQGMLWSTSPACTELETHVLDWLVRMKGLPEHYLSSGSGGGVIQDTASSATLCALIAARERTDSFESGSSGVNQADSPMITYCSSQAHSSVEKAVRIAGLGTDNLRIIDVDGDYAMDVEHLERVIKDDIDAGRRPCMVVAVSGTTSSNAFDPIDRIAMLCREHGIWLHVDAAMSGTAMLCPEHRHLFDGVEHADSYCFNPHKWMFTNFDCNCFWVADRSDLVRSLSILPEYLRNSATESGRVIDYRDWQIPLGRRFRALKLWFVIRHYGVNGLQELVRGHIELAAEFASWIEEDDRFQLAAPAPLNLVCFRHVDGDEFNERLLEKLNHGGEMYLSHTRLDDRYTLRMSIGQSRVERSNIERAWSNIRRVASDSGDT